MEFGTSEGLRIVFLHFTAFSFTICVIPMISSDFHEHSEWFGLKCLAARRIGSDYTFTGPSSMPAVKTCER